MATSRQGMSVVKHLASSKKYKIKALTRNPYSKKAAELSNLKNVEVIKGDLLDKKSLRNAFKGVTGIFGNTTPTTGWKFIKGSISRDYEIAQGRNLIDEVEYCRKNGSLKHFIFSSVCKPKDPLKNNPAPGHFTSKWDIEEYINQKKLIKNISTFLRPVSYYENFDINFSILKYSKQFFPGLVDGDKKWQTIAVDDIGKWARAIFNTPDRFKGKELNIAGEELTGNEMGNVYYSIQHEKVAGGYIKLPNIVVKILEEDLAIMADWIERTGYGADMKNLKSLAKELEVERTSLSTWLSKKLNLDNTERKSNKFISQRLTSVRNIDNGYYL